VNLLIGLLVIWGVLVALPFTLFWLVQFLTLCLAVSVNFAEWVIKPTRRFLNRHIPWLFMRIF